MKTQEVISSVEPNMENGKILFEHAKVCFMGVENFYTIEAAKKRKNKKDEDEDDDEEEEENDEETEEYN